MFGDEYLRELRKDREDEANRMDMLVYVLALVTLFAIVMGWLS